MESWENYKRFHLRDGMKSRFAVLDKPLIEICYTPEDEKLAIQFSCDEESVPDLRRTHFHLSRFSRAGQFYWSIETVDTAHYQHLYTLLEACVSLVLRGRIPAHIAIQRAIIDLEEFLSKQRDISEETEIGLVGELVTLERLIRRDGPLAVEYWRGPQRDRHDFRFAGFEVEVKTTAAGSRHHWFSDLSQVLPSERFSLFVLSIHLVRSTKGGFSVNSKKRDIEGLLASSPPMLSLFNKQLDSIAETATWNSASTAFDRRDSDRLVTVSDPSLQSLTGWANDALQIERLRSAKFLVDLQGLGVEIASDTLIELAGD